MTSQSRMLSKKLISQPTMRQRIQQVANDSTIKEHVLSTHKGEYTGFDSKLVLSIVENILRLNMDNTNDEVMVEKLKHRLEVFNHKELPLKIKQLLLEIALGLNAIDQHSTTMEVLNMLYSYPWEAKLVLMLAAFSIIYAKLCLVSRLREINGLSKKLAQLKHISPNPTPSSSSSHIIPKAVIDCVSSVFELTKCIVELKQMSSFPTRQSVISALPMTCYWIGRSIINCAVNCVHFEVQNELAELNTLIVNILQNTFSPELERKKAEESYEALQYALYHNNSSKMSDVFKLMFNVKNDYDGIFRSRGIYYWNDKRVFLLITSSLDISMELKDYLNWFYGESKPYILWIPIVQNDASWTIEDEHQCRNTTTTMRFFWLNDSQKRLLPQFNRFVKEKLFPNFQIGGEPILVSLDPQGRIVHPNAMNMIMTWSPDSIEKNTTGIQRQQNITPFIVKELKEGTSSVNRVIPEIEEMISKLAHDIDKKINDWTKVIEKKIQDLIEQSTPYESEREKALWQQETIWSLDLLIARFRPSVFPRYFNTFRDMINDWIDEEKYIFLYGGNDIKWVREFAFKVYEVHSKTQLDVELAYVGKNKIIRAIIEKENLSHCPLDTSSKVWFFWMRLQNMFSSRIRYLNASNQFDEEHNDAILQGLKKLLYYEGKNSTIRGWILFCKGNNEVILCRHGTKILRVLNDYKIWKENIATKGFGQAFKDHHKMLDSSSFSSNNHCCCSLEYPTILEKILENEKCPECSRYIYKFLTFTCCHNHD